MLPVFIMDLTNHMVFPPPQLVLVKKAQMCQICKKKPLIQLQIFIVELNVLGRSKKHAGVGQEQGRGVIANTGGQKSPFQVDLGTKGC